MSKSNKIKHKNVRPILALDPDTMAQLDGLFGHDREGRRKREIATWLIFNRAIVKATGRGVDLDAKPYCDFKRGAVEKLFKIIPYVEHRGSQYDAASVLAGG